MTNEERVTPAPVDLAAVEARPAFRCTDDTGTEAPEPHVHMTAADRDALTKALRIAVEALDRLSILGNEPLPGNSLGNVEAQLAVRYISALVVIR